MSLFLSKQVTTFPQCLVTEVHTSISKKNDIYTCFWSLPSFDGERYLQKTRGVAVAIFSFRFPVFHFPVGYRLTVSYLRKHENQILSILWKQEF